MFFRAPDDLTCSAHISAKVFKNLFDPPIGVLCVSEAEQFSYLVQREVLFKTQTDRESVLRRQCGQRAFETLLSFVLYGLNFRVCRWIGVVMVQRVNFLVSSMAV